MSLAEFADPGTQIPVDVAVNHWTAFAWMFILMLIFGMARVAEETKAPVKIASFFHWWMFAYLLLLTILMTITTGIALTLLFDDADRLRFHVVPLSVAPAASAIAGVFGFEILFRKLIVGFGETQFDLEKTLRNILDQAVAATLKKEAS